MLRYILIIVASLVIFTVAAIAAEPPAPPVELPPELPGGEKSLLDKCEHTWQYDYTDGSTINVYLMSKPEDVTDALTAMAETGEKLTESENSSLFSAGAIIHRHEKGFIISFGCKAYLIRLTTGKDALKEKSAVKVCEEILEGYRKRIDGLYATPEKTVLTLLEAIRENDVDLAFECFAIPEGETDDKFRKRLAISFTKKISTGYGSRPMSYETKVGKKKPDGKNRVIIRVETIATDNMRFRGSYTPSWAVKVRHLAGFEEPRTRQDTPYHWLPLVKAGKSWKIDLDRLAMRKFYQTFEACITEEHASRCEKNLERIRQYIEQKGGSTRLPETLRELAGRGRRPRSNDLVCPGGPGRPEDHKGFYTNYNYIPYYMPVRKLPPKTIIIYCGKDYHKTKGPGRMVLYSPFRVKWVREDEFQKLLAVSEKLARDNEIAKKIRKGEDVLLPPEEDKRIRALVNNLGSADWHTRDAAFEELARIGIRTYGILTEHKNSDDPEVGRLIRKLLRNYE